MEDIFSMWLGVFQSYRSVSNNKFEWIQVMVKFEHSF